MDTTLEKVLQLLTDPHSVSFFRERECFHLMAFPHSVSYHPNFIWYTSQWRNVGRLLARHYFLVPPRAFVAPTIFCRRLLLSLSRPLLYPLELFCPSIVVNPGFVIPTIIFFLLTVRPPAIFGRRPSLSMLFERRYSCHLAPPCNSAPQRSRGNRAYVTPLIPSPVLFHTLSNPISSFVTAISVSLSLRHNLFKFVEFRLFW